MKKYNIAFVSTSLGGIGNVSKESRKWSEVFMRMGHQCHYFAGELKNSHPGTSCLEAMRDDPVNVEFLKKSFDPQYFKEKNQLIGKLEKVALSIEDKMHMFVKRNSIDLLIVENISTVPENLALGVAVNSFVSWSKIPTVFHHFNLHWLLERFSTPILGSTFTDNFPGEHPHSIHVLLSSVQKEELEKQYNIEGRVIPQVMDFSGAPKSFISAHNKNFRQDFGFSGSDKLFYFPSRISPRKNLELTIALIEQFASAEAHLLMSREATSYSYIKELKQKARDSLVPLHWLHERSSLGGEPNDKGDKSYTPSDFYCHSDIVCFSSHQEGFGEVLLEAVYHRKPLFLKRYPVYAHDIACLGFEFLESDGKVDASHVQKLKKIFSDPAFTQKLVERNFEIAQDHFSFEKLEKHLKKLLEDLFS